MRELSILITAQDDGKTVRFIALKRLCMSSAQFKRAKFQGEILLDGVPVHADRRVRTGDVFVIRIPQTASGAVAPAAIALTVSYEDDDILVIDKPAPLASIGSAKQAGPTLENAVCAYLGAPEGFVYRPVNRLDKGTSGLMVVAKHAHAQQYLQKRLHGGTFIREYLAVCSGLPPAPEGVIDAPIAKADGATIRRIVCPSGKPARTDYRVEGVFGRLQPASAPAAHGPHAPDPRASGLHRLPRGGRFPLRYGAPAASLPLCPAQRAFGTGIAQRKTHPAGKPPAGCADAIAV